MPVFVKDPIPGPTFSLTVKCINRSTQRHSWNGRSRYPPENLLLVKIPFAMMHELMNDLIFTIYHAMENWEPSSGGTDGYQPPYYLEIKHEGWRIAPGLKDALNSKAVGL